MLSEYDKIARKGAVYSQFRNLWDIWKFNNIFNSFAYVFENHINITIDPKKSEDVLWREIHPKRRNKIRKSLKEGTSVRELTYITDVEMIYDILNVVYRHARLPIVDISIFESSFESLVPQGMIKYFGAYNNKKLIGVRCILTYRKTLYD